MRFEATVRRRFGDKRRQTEEHQNINIFYLTWSRMKTIVKLVTGQVGKWVENKTNIIRIRIILEELRTSCLVV